MADVTVVTPVLPGRGMVWEAEASVLAQTVGPVAHLLEVDSDLEGPGALMNRLIGRVDTTWFSVLPDDDLYDPDHLESLLAVCDDADIVFSWGRIPQHHLDGYVPYRGLFSPELFLARQESGLTGCFMGRKSLWESVGGYIPGMLEDWDFLARAILGGARVVPVYRETWTYRMHPGSQSALLHRTNMGDRPDELDNMFLGKLFPKQPVVVLNRAMRRKRKPRSKR